MATPFNGVTQLCPFFSSSGERQGISVLSSNFVQPTLVVCGSFEGGICLVDLTKSLPTQRCHGHERAITDVSFLPSDPALLISSSRDGTGSVFDSRLPPEVNRVSRVRLSLDSDEADTWSIDVGGASERLLACSVDETIRMYDLRVVAEASYNDPKRRKSRSTGLVWNFQESHTALINYIRFHPIRRSLLVSGADDDLICVQDTNKCEKGKSRLVSSSSVLTSHHNIDKNKADDSDDDVSDDTTFIGGLNNESPPRVLRFVGPHSDVLCSISTTEIVQAYHCPSLSSINQQHSFEYIIESYSTASTASSPFPCYNNNQCSSVNDEDFQVQRLIAPTSAIRTAPQLKDGDSSGYVVNVIYDDITERLFSLGGSATGRLILFHLNANECDLVSPFIASKGWGHSSVVRCSEVIPNSNTGPVIATGSEDGMLCLWAQKKS